MTPDLRAVFLEAVARMDPEARVRAAVRLIDFGGRACDDVAAIAIGKAAVAMARGAAGVASRGLIVAPAGGTLSGPWPILVGAHPVPDARSEAAGRALIAFVRSVPESSLLLALVSGGASALAAVPRDGLTLDEKIARVREVVASGAPIAEINRVRTSLSAIKGGKLAAMCAAPVVTLVASDVVGDDPRVVGSGPTISIPAAARGAAPGPRTRASRDVLGSASGLGPAPTRGGIRGGSVRVIAGIADLARAAVDAAAARGISAGIKDAQLAGDVGAVAARVIAALEEPGPPLAVWAGEPTIALPASPGQGGRAQQLALLVARGGAGRSGWTFLAAGSDGVDGTGPAAGAIVDGATWGAIAGGDDALARCDAGTALAAVGATIVTGPTGVNHADLLLLLRGAP